MNILNCQDIGSFHFFTIQYEKPRAISPAIMTVMPLKTELLYVYMKKFIPFGSMTKRL
jgi:hypothetical protein